MREPIKDVLLSRRVVCTVGSGGVGKTTCAAAVGLAGAVMGRRTLVLTIDPARRLADAMGLGPLGAEERTLSPEALQAMGVPASAALSVRMLDLKAAWDDMVRRLSPTPQKAQEILQNRFYRYLSTELAGAQEYIACEALYSLSHEHAFDLVVLDTPPTANALDFLEAPQRILSILNHDAVKWASRPAGAAFRLGTRLFEVAGGAAMKALEKVAGGETLTELAEFLVLFEGLFEPLRSRTAAVQKLLASDGTSFLLVASAEMGPLNQARFFLEHLRDMDLHLGCVVINRMRVVPADMPPQDVLEAALSAAGSTDPAADVRAAALALADAQRLAAREADVVAPLAASVGSAPVLRVPRLGDDVHDVPGLWRLAQRLMHPVD